MFKAHLEAHMVEVRIISDPRILCGKPVIAGTRISVELIVEELHAGMTIDELLIDYPHITREDVLAVVAYAAGMGRVES